MSAAFVPYRSRAPVTTDLRELKAEHERCRAEHGRRSHEAAESWARWCREAGAQGQPLDGLRRHVADEAERFFAQTIQGPDGHVYWDGGKTFMTNAGHKRVPRLWWWERDHPPLGAWGQTVRPTCGEANCINPDHGALAARERERIYSDAQMLGALQVVAIRLGRSPTQDDWDKMRMRPTRNVYLGRFGGWPNSLRAAGLTVLHRGQKAADAQACLASLRAARRFLGRTPTVTDYRRDLGLREALREANLPTSATAIKKHCGSWLQAVKDALG